MVGAILWVYARRVQTIRSVRALLRGRRRLRVSFSALLRVEHEGRYLLVRQGLHRPDQLGPLGGVYKVLGDGVPNELDFRPLPVDDEARARSISDDLRGTIPAHQLGPLVRWFDRRVGRESDALHREVQEELGETGVVLPDGLFPLRAELMHVAEEGPVQVREHDPVFRRHEVYHLRHGIGLLLDSVEGNDRFRLVTEEEIRSGQTRADKIVIGDQTAFLLSPKPLTGSRHF